MTKVLFLTSFCSEIEEVDLINISKVGIQNSIIQFQRNMLNGIIGVNEQCDVINFYPVGTFPKYNMKLFFKSEVLSYDTKSQYRRLFTVNVPIIKNVLHYIQAYIHINLWIKKHEHFNMIVIMYDLLFPYLSIISKINNSNVKTISIVADLPNQFGYKKSHTGLKKLLLELLGRKNIKDIRGLSYLGLVTKFMAIPLDISENKYTVIEGFSNNKRIITPIIQSNKFVILYSGALFKIYGLKIMLDAFINFNHKNAELWICGAGDFIQEIKNYTFMDNRIKFLGYKSHDEVLDLQSKATILINPRQNTDDYTKYSFPSKIIEYLASGRPTISYRLDGIPLEYFNYLFVPSSNSVNSLLEVYESLYSFSLDDLNKAGINGRQFVLNRTNSVHQIQKLFVLNHEISN